MSSYLNNKTKIIKRARIIIPLAVLGLVIIGLVFYFVNRPQIGREQFSADLRGGAKSSQNNQNDSASSVIHILKVEKLDKNKNFIEDITEKVKTKDNDWVTFNMGQYIRVVFEKALTSVNDITLYARSELWGVGDPTNLARIGVYAENYAENEEFVAEFPEIKQARSYKILLTSLQQSSNTFDLKINCGVSETPQSCSGVEVDFIVDPSDAGVKINSGVKLLAGVQLPAPVASWTCGDTLTDTRDSQDYTTVLIGSQCWMRQNLNVGTKVLIATYPQGTDCSTASAIEKYCYADSDANCTTYGGLYEWNQAMCGSTTSGATGICPTGWHIPTHDEFTTLERAVCTSGTCATDFPYDITTTGWRGTNEGTTLKTVSVSTFSGLLAGYRLTSGSFGYVSTLGFFWSSLQSGGSAWDRSLASDSAQVYRSTFDKARGFSVRCLKN